MKMTVAQAMVKCLEQEQIQTVFGYPGAAICPFYDALLNSPIEHLLIRQEQMGGHCANGLARVTGRPQVCIATSGPGALNLITGIATAYMDSIPLVCITGQVNSDQLGKDVFQEADITGAVEPFSKYSYIVKDGSQIARIFKEAFYLAGTGRPGPVVIDVPTDIQNQTIDFEYPETISMRSYKPTVVGNARQITRAAAALKKAKRPLIVAGGGIFAAGSVEELNKLAAKSGIPVVTTLMGKGAVRDDDPYYMGMIGTHGVGSANQALAHADALLIAGARAGDRSIKDTGVIARDCTVIHLDIDPAEIGKNIAVDIPIVGDARQVLNALAEQVPYLCCEDWLARLVDLRSRNSTRSLGSDEAYVNPKEFFLRLSEKAPDNAVLTADVGQNQIWAANYYKVKRGRFLTSGGMGTMGYAIPAAAGVQTADPSRTVMAVCGDGGFQMSMMELGTIAYYKLPVKIIVLNNHFLGMVKELQDRGFGRRETAVELGDKPDIAALAGCYNIPSKKLTSMAECDGAIQWLLSTEGPCLLECLVHPDESTL